MALCTLAVLNPDPKYNVYDTSPVTTVGACHDRCIGFAGFQAAPTNYPSEQVGFRCRCCSQHDIDFYDKETWQFNETENKTYGLPSDSQAVSVKKVKIDACVAVSHKAANWAYGSAPPLADFGGDLIDSGAIQDTWYAGGENSVTVFRYANTTYKPKIRQIGCGQDFNDRVLPYGFFWFSTAGSC